MTLRAEAGPQRAFDDLPTLVNDASVHRLFLWGFAGGVVFLLLLLAGVIWWRWHRSREGIYRKYSGRGDPVRRRVVGGRGDTRTRNRK